MVIHRWRAHRTLHRCPVEGFGGGIAEGFEQATGAIQPVVQKHRDARGSMIRVPFSRRDMLAYLIEPSVAPWKNRASPRPCVCVWWGEEGPLVVP